MTIYAIWAQSRDRIIGDGHSMLWHIPQDLAFFKERTRGSAVLMGRATWDSLDPRFRPLPKRHNIVLTHNPARSDLSDARVHVLTHLPDEESLHALADASPTGDLWIIGGGTIYTALLPYVEEVWVTIVDLVFGPHSSTPTHTPVYAPELGEEFTLVTEESFPSDNGAPSFRLCHFVRV